MSGRGLFVQRLGRTRNFAAAALIAAAVHAADGVDRPIALQPFARSYEPGEVVRFVVETAPSVKTLTGEFFGKTIAFVLGRSESTESAWVGWGVIPLDSPAGVTTITVSGTGAVTVTAEITVIAKTFPEQRLTVESKFVSPGKAALTRIEREKKKLNSVYAKRTPLTPPSMAFVRPVPGEPTSEFGTRRIFNGEPRAPHPGIDLRAATGTPVLCAGSGKVALAESLYYSGGTVIVDHGAGLFTIYAHLSKIGVKAGAPITAGDEVGKSGATGRVTGPHLHWGARVGAEIFDPRGLLDPRLFE